MILRIIIVVLATVLITTAECPPNRGPFIVDWDTAFVCTAVTGSELDRFNVVFLAEGFQGGVYYWAEINSRVSEAMDAIFAMEPFSEYTCAFNFYEVDLESRDLGADHPWRQEEPKCVDTALNATFGSKDKNLPERMLVIPIAQRLIDAAWMVTTNVDLIVVLVNDDSTGGVAADYGGIPFVTVSVGKGFHEVLTHELAHALTEPVGDQTGPYLGEEYSCGCCVLEDCPPGFDSLPSRECCPEDLCPPGTHEQIVYTGTPAEVKEWANATTETNYDDIKWRQLITVPTSAIPTTDADIVGLGESAVGLFEGAAEYQRGVYRPQRECHMRALRDTLTGEIEPFCAVCRSVLEAALKRRCVLEHEVYVNPLLFRSNYALFGSEKYKWLKVPLPPCVGCPYGQKNTIRVDLEGLPPQVVATVEEMTGKEVGRGRLGPKGALNVEFSANMGDEYFLTLAMQGDKFEMLEFTARVWINGEEIRLPN